MHHLVRSLNDDDRLYVNKAVFQWLSEWFQIFFDLAVWRFLMNKILSSHAENTWLILLAKTLKTIRARHRVRAKNLLHAICFCFYESHLENHFYTVYSESSENWWQVYFKTLVIKRFQFVLIEKLPKIYTTFQINQELILLRKRNERKHRNVN